MRSQPRLGLRMAPLIVAALLFGCRTQTPAPNATPQFVLGADVSALDAPYRRGGNRIYQENGVTNEEWAILMKHGWTAFRLRVFLSPVRNAPRNTMEATIPLAKRIKDAGGIVLLAPHFSDTWADPQHQEIPTAWTNLDFDGLEHAWELYASNLVWQFKVAGAMPDWVQIGNEITRGTQWPLARLQVPGSTNYSPPQPYDEARQFDRLVRLLKAGIRGVKEGAGDTPPRIAIHIDQGGNWKNTEWFFDHLNAAHVDYDIIAESFYPPWRHGTLEDLWTNLQQCARRYHKDFLVVETGYGRSHFRDNQDMLWPVTAQGRLQFMVDLINTVKRAPGGLGVMYWAPEWDVWNADGSPGPAVSALDDLDTLTNRPASHAPPQIFAH